MNSLSVEIVTGSQALTDLRAEWQALFKITSASPFLSWEWITTWYKWFGREKNPFVFCARENGKLVGLLPLGEEEAKGSRLMPKARKFSFLGEPQGAPDYQDVLSLPGYEQKCADAIFAKLADWDGFDLLVMEGMLAESATLPVIALRFGNRPDFTYQIMPQYPCPQVLFEGTYEEVLEGLRRRDYFDRTLRKLSKFPAFELRVVSEPDEVKDACERFIDLHEDRWKARGGSAATNSPEAKGFMIDSARSLAEGGMMRFEEMWFEGSCRASLFGIESGDSYYNYLYGFDQSYAKYSLGFLIVGVTVRGALQRGLKRYDFLRGGEPYKFDYANHTAMTVSAQIVGNSKAARFSLAQSSAKEIARALVPERVKNFRRQLRQRFRPEAAEGETAKQNSDRAAESANATPASDLYSLPR